MKIKSGQVWYNEITCAFYVSIGIGVISEEAYVMETYVDGFYDSFWINQSFMDNLKNRWFYICDLDAENEKD